MATSERRSGATAERATPVSALQGAWWKWGMGLMMCYVIYGAFFVAGGAIGFGRGGDKARIVFFHVPPAVLSSLCYFIGAFFAVMYLFKQYNPRKAADIDAKSTIAMELGFLSCILATITGSIFAGLQWDNPWNWDPREISIVIMLLIYASYLVLRSALANRPEKRAKLAAVYAIVALVPAQFLIWAVPRLLAGNHPTKVLVNKEGLSVNYSIVLYPSFLAFILLYLWMSQLRFRAYKLRTRLEGKRV